jgi:methionyl-tRNA synthetase
MSNKTKGKAFYITTTLPYVNADPHVGFGAEIIRADIVARAKILQGYEVFFNTGTDEHGQKLFDEAKKNNEDVKLYVDRFAERFKGLKDLLGLYDGIHFIRTTDKHHIKSAQHFWNLCKANGDIYKKNYKIKYCVGCELEKMESELVDGKCPVHPNRELEIREEENYFFRWSKYQDKLLEFYEKNPDFVLPDFRFNEIKKFVERGLEDFSISRLKSKMSWGIEVPDDSEHVMYVWFDALINYISTLGWPEDIDTFEKFWIEGNPVQYAGKDNLRQQSAMWQAMLMSAGINNTKTIVINGFIQSGGQKMSKSLGNVINPYDVVSVYGKDVLRLYVAKELSWSEDSDMTMERFKDAYNANLANGLGNLVSRVMKMAEGNLQKPVEIVEFEDMTEYFDLLNRFEINKACDFVWQKISEMDKFIQDNQPFKVIKTDKEKGVEMIETLVKNLYTVARMLNPIMPETSQKIKELVKTNKAPETPLFLRKD